MTEFIKTTFLLGGQRYVLLPFQQCFILSPTLWRERALGLFLQIGIAHLQQRIHIRLILAGDILQQRWQTMSQALRHNFFRRLLKEYSRSL